MKLAEIIGYRLDMARCASRRSLSRVLGDTPYNPADTTALLLIKERPGCDQTTLGYALAGNRSVGMKMAARLEAHGLLVRQEGRDRRSKGLYLTPEGERVLDDLLARHAEAEALLTDALSAAERELLLRLLEKIEHAVLHEEEQLTRGPTPPAPASPTGERQLA